MVNLVKISLANISIVGQGSKIQRKSLNFQLIKDRRHSLPWFLNLKCFLPTSIKSFELLNCAFYLCDLQLLFFSILTFLFLLVVFFFSPSCFAQVNISSWIDMDCRLFWPANTFLRLFSRCQWSFTLISVTPVTE